MTICAFFQSPVSVCLKLLSYDRLWLVWLGMFLRLLSECATWECCKLRFCPSRKAMEKPPSFKFASNWFDSHFVSFPGGCFDWLPVSHAFSASPCQLIVTCSARLWAYLIITWLTQIQRPELFSGWKLILQRTDATRSTDDWLLTPGLPSIHQIYIDDYWCKLRFEWYIHMDLILHGVW